MNKLPSFISITKDVHGSIRFQADMCGETLFKSVKQATEAYKAARRAREAKEEAEREASPNRCVFDGESFKVWCNNCLFYTFPCADRNAARKLFDPYFDSHVLVFKDARQTDREDVKQKKSSLNPHTMPRGWKPHPPRGPIWILLNAIVRVRLGMMNI